MWKPGCGVSNPGADRAAGAEEPGGWEAGLAWAGWGGPTAPWRGTACVAGGWDAYCDAGGTALLGAAAGALPGGAAACPEALTRPACSTDATALELTPVLPRGIPAPAAADAAVLPVVVAPAPLAAQGAGGPEAAAPGVVLVLGAPLRGVLPVEVGWELWLMETRGAPLPDGPSLRAGGGALKPGIVWAPLPEAAAAAVADRRLAAMSFARGLQGDGGGSWAGGIGRAGSAALPLFGAPVGDSMRDGLGLVPHLLPRAKRTAGGRCQQGTKPRMSSCVLAALTSPSRCPCMGAWPGSPPRSASAGPSGFWAQAGENGAHAG